jgi:hypothetical protein
VVAEITVIKPHRTLQAQAVVLARAVPYQSTALTAELVVMVIHRQ